jgi:hypothetical protein
MVVQPARSALPLHLPSAMKAAGERQQMGQVARAMIGDQHGG